MSVERATGSSGAEAESARETSLSGRLGVSAILFMVLAAAAPLGVVAGAVPVGALLGNGAGLPALFVVAAIVLLLFAVGMTAMATRIPRPGAFFTYIGVGLGRPVGVGAAWLAMLTYTSIQAALYAFTGASLSATVRALGGPELHWSIYALVVLVAVGVLGYRHIDLSARVLSVLLTLEVLIVLVLVGAIVLSGGAEGLSAESFTPSAVLSGAPGIGLIFVVGAFIGFESTAIFRSEARDPDRTVPKATYLAVIGVGIFYALASWGLIMGWGPSQLVEVISADLDDILVTTTGRYLGTVGAVIVNVLLITSLFASILAFHNIVARYQHVMARVGLLPSGLSRVHRSHGSPYMSSLVQSATALVLVGLFAALGMDPILQTYSWFAGVATLAVVVLMAATSVSVIVFFWRRKDGGVWRTLVAPILGGIGLIVFIVAIVVYFPLLIGDVDGAGEPVFGLVSLTLLGLLLIFAAIGVVQALILRRRAPEQYATVIESISETSTP